MQFHYRKPLQNIFMEREVYLGNQKKFAALLINQSRGEVQRYTVM